MSAVSIRLLADRPELIDAVGLMRWREWGRDPEPEDPQWWVNATSQEAGRNKLPVTYVALNDVDEPLGAIGLGTFDIRERRDRSPWVLGMIVRADVRRSGIGRRLLTHMEHHAVELAYQAVWVATREHAVDFYQRCGYRPIEALTLATGSAAHVLMKQV